MKAIDTLSRRQFIQTTATLMMSVEAYRQKRQVRWDAEKEEIV